MKKVLWVDSWLKPKRNEMIDIVNDNRLTVPRHYNLLYHGVLYLFKRVNFTCRGGECLTNWSNNFTLKLFSGIETIRPCLLRPLRKEGNKWVKLKNDQKV